MSDYRRDPRGFLVRVKPKTFRRGRIQWEGGESHTLRVATGGKKNLQANVALWVGARPVGHLRVKVHTK